jgi:hypothetical protein
MTEPNAAIELYNMNSWCSGLVDILLLTIPGSILDKVMLSTESVPQQVLRCTALARPGCWVAIWAQVSFDQWSGTMIRNTSSSVTNSRCRDSAP